MKRDIFSLAMAGLLVLSACVMAADALPTMPPGGPDNGDYDKGGRYPAGVINTVSYYSPSMGSNNTMWVYTPPEYNPSQKYAVVYGYPGIGAGADTIFAGWCVAAGTIADNLIGEGKIQPLIIVAVDSNNGDVQADTLNVIIPYIDSHYSTYPYANNRGIYGYSWGGGYTFNIGCKNLDTFRYLSPSAAAPNKGGDDWLFPNGGAEAKEKMKCLFISWGQHDYGSIIDANRNCVTYCTANGISHYSWEVAGQGHTAGVWRPAMWNFLQLADAAGISNPPVPRSAYSQIEAESYNTRQGGVQAEDCSEGGQDIGTITNGSYLVFRDIDFGGGAVSFDARVSSATSGGSIELYLDSLTGTQIGTCTVAGTGGWQSWVTKSCPVSGVSGIHDLYVKFTGGGGYLFNINWWKFNRTAGQDIGAVGIAGSDSYASGMFTVTGAGADIGGTSDAFRFVNAAATGDCTITARVSSLQNIDPWSKAGVMIRQSLAANAANVFIAVTPDNGVNWQYRSSAGGSTSDSNTAGPSAPYWVKLVRSGDTFTGYTSTDGVMWTSLGSTTIAMGSAVYVGLAVTSHTSSALCTAAFDNMTAPNWPTSAAPAGVSAIGESPTQISLLWNPSARADAYRVKRSMTSGGPYTLIADGITTNSYYDTGLTTNTAYYYVVTAKVGGSQTPNSAQAEATPRNLRARLKFDESSGAAAADFTGNGWDGMLVNGPLWTTGKFGKAVDLDGSNDYVSLGAGVVNGLTDFTISVWVNLDTISTWSRIFDFGTGTDVNMFLTPRSGSGSVRFAITIGGGGSEQQINGSSALPTGAWTHVAVTLQGSTGTLYVNGSRVGSNGSMTLTPSSLGATTQNYIGKSQYPDPYLDGRVDEFRLYPNALSAAEIKSLHEEQTHVIPPVPTALTATAVSSSRIDLAWDGSAGAASCNVKRSAIDGGPYALIAAVEGTSFSDIGLPEKTTWYYVVSAANNAGESGDSVQAEATTPPAPPAVVSGLTAAAGDGSVTLNWNANSEADLAGYNVYRSITPGSGYSLLNGSLLNSPEFTDNNLSNYATYYYVVTAVDAETFESAFSSEVEATPFDSRAVQLSAADFESGFGDWVNISGQDSHDWTRHSGGTLTPNTGPSGGANGSTRYVYLETSPGYANLAGHAAILESSEIKGFARILTFYYHMYGTDTGTLNVDVYDGVWHESVWSLSGQQHTAGSEAYTKALVDLTSFTGPIQIRFRAVAAGGPRGDMAIDDIEVTGRGFYGDMNGDSIVNADDLLEFAGYWLQDDCTLDLNGDCVINLYEFAEFAGNWLNVSFQ